MAKQIVVKKSKMLQAVVYNGGIVKMIWPNEPPELVIDQNQINVEKVIKFYVRSDQKDGWGYLDDQIMKIMETFDGISEGKDNFRRFVGYLISQVLYKEAK